MSFKDRIQEFNKLYGLPTPDKPTITSRHEMVLRLIQFQKMLGQELAECDEIMSKMADDTTFSDVYVMAELADWLGDIIVYSASEMARHGLPLDQTLNIIMESNMSKQVDPGQPQIIDGKVQKGPRYWKPEPMLRTMIDQELRT